jgi:hypothetical protein
MATSALAAVVFAATVTAPDRPNRATSILTTLISHPRGQIMRSMLIALVGVFLIPLGSAASARESSARLVCPGAYERLGEICVSRTSGDIVLPTSKKAATTAQTRAVR